MHHHHHLAELALVGALALGAYELYHLERYGNFGFGDPNNNGISFGGYGAPYATQYGYGNPTYGHHHGHHHHHIL
jgi:hypothetical protein